MPKLLFKGPGLEVRRLGSGYAEAVLAGDVAGETALPDLPPLRKLTIRADFTGNIPDSIAAKINGDTEVSLCFGGNSFPDWSGIFMPIKKLNLMANTSGGYGEFPAWVSKLINLEKLLVDNNGRFGWKYPDALGNLTNLRELNIYYLDDPYDWVRNLKKLRKLFFGIPLFDSVPEWIGELTELRELSILEGEIDTLPESIGNLTKLKDLYFVHTYMPGLPYSIGRLKKIKRLELHGVRALPESIGGLQSLEWLFIRSHKLKALPESIGCLKSLKSLTLMCGRLTSLPESFCGLESLEELVLWCYRLTQLPEDFGNLRRLKELDLACYSLTHLPESFDSLEALQKADLGRCGIEKC